jgi:uncharacterized membrane protein YkgB
MGNFLISTIAGLEGFGKNMVRFGIVVVYLWIGGLKFFAYEAEGIVPFVANSPFMSFFYNDPSHYKQYVNKEGEYLPVNRRWHAYNNTYEFSQALGVFLVTVAVLVSLHKAAPLASMIGSGLIVLMSLGTLSFLVTTPESWVPPLGDAHSDFPYLSGRGRLVIKDLVILGGAIVTMSESAKLYLSRKKNVFLSITAQKTRSAF